MHFLNCLSPLKFTSSFQSFPAGWIVYHFWLEGVNAHNISCNMYREKKKFDIRSLSIFHCITEQRMLLHNQTRWFRLIFVQFGTHLESRLATLFRPVALPSALSSGSGSRIDGPASEFVCISERFLDTELERFSVSISRSGIKSIVFVPSAVTSSNRFEAIACGGLCQICASAPPFSYILSLFALPLMGQRDQPKDRLQVSKRHHDHGS